MAAEIHVLVTGSGGQLGQSLKKTLPTGIKAHFVGKSALNLENADAIAAWFASNKADFIINTAAYTKVDQAEKENAAAFAANEAAVRNLTQAARKSGSYIIHISTDFLFHGAFNRPIDETQEINPLGIYAQSKAAGEQALIAEKIPSAIVRTSWLYSEFNANFMKTMIRLGRARSGGSARVADVRSRPRPWPLANGSALQSQTRTHGGHRDLPFQQPRRHHLV
jgi:dTDP-4-dehydrorhamnose reductase